MLGRTMQLVAIALAAIIGSRITDKGRIEHFHTTDFERRDGKTMVTINRDPKIVASVKSGDRIEIPEPDITDWNYMGRAS